MSSNWPPTSAPARSLELLAAGAAAGFFLAQFVGPLVGLEFDTGKSLAGMLVGATVLCGLWSWIRAGRLPSTLAPLAVLVLVIHLLAAGGISFPGVADTFWILLALGVNQTAGAHRTTREPGRVGLSWSAVAGMALAGAAATACYLTAYRPVLRWNTAMYQAQEAQDRRDPRRQTADWVEASLADPLSAQSWQFLADLDFERLMQRGATEPARERFELALRAMLARRPSSSSMYRQAGRWMLRLFDRTQNPQDAARAIEYYGRAVELYPNSAQTHADYALALRALGQHQRAQRETERALALDAAMPHVDKRLPKELREKLQAAESADGNR